MTWLKIDDKFTRHPKVRKLSHSAFRLHVGALCHSAEMLTDGRITEDDIRMLVPICGLSTWKRYVNECISAGLWTVETHGWSINDYLDYNPSSTQVRERRIRDASRQKSKRTSMRTSERSHAVSPSAPSRTRIEKERLPTDAIGSTSVTDPANVIDLTSVLKDVS